MEKPHNTMGVDESDDTNEIIADKLDDSDLAPCALVS